MTDRYRSLTVTLSRDTRDDDAEGLMKAIALMHGVLSVEGNVVDSADYVARTRARLELAEKIMPVLYPHIATEKGD